MNIYKIKSRTFQIVCEPADHAFQPLTSPRAAEPVLRALYSTLDESQEHFMVLCLDVRGGLVGFKHLSSGTETACLVTPSGVFRAALVLGGVSVLCCHNHPSGDPSPSREDVALTAKLTKAADDLGITFADHIILGRDSIHSFRASAPTMFHY